MYAGFWTDIFKIVIKLFWILLVLAVFFFIIILIVWLQNKLKQKVLPNASKEPSKGANKIFLIVMLGFIFIFFIIAAIVNASTFYNSAKSLFWDKASGIITKSELGPPLTFVDKSESWKNRMYRTKTIQDFDIEYAYSVSGKDYSSDKIGFGIPIMPYTSDSQKVVSQFPINSDVIVYYNPNNPAESVLLRGFGWHNWDSLLYVILPLLVIIYVVFEFKRRGYI